MNTFWRCLPMLLTTVLALRGPAARAQTVYQPVAVSGFTDDVVVDGWGPANGSATNPVDQGVPNVRWCYTAPSYRTFPLGHTPSTALPANGRISSGQTPGLTFQLMPYAGLNSLRLAGTSTGTLALATPQAATEVYVLAACGNGSSPVSITVTFTDQATQTFPALVPDWYGGPNYAIQGVSRVNFDTNAIENNTTDPRMYEVRLPLTATTAGKLVESLTFTKTSAAIAPILNVMAVSLGRACALPTGTLRATPAGTCPGQPVQLSALLSTSGSFGLQWQRSTDNGLTWTDIAGATQPTYTATPLVSTHYRLRTACTSGAALLGPVAVTVAAPGPPATLTYATGSLCPAAASVLPLAFGPAGGHFSAPAGLALDAATGRVSPAASVPGFYTITYTVPGNCPSVATAALTVQAPAVVTLAYTAPEFCTAGANPSPVATPGGGRFSSSTAALALDAATGAIDLARTPPGTYLVAYAVPGACGGEASTAVTIRGSTLPVFPNVITPGPDTQNPALTFHITEVREYQLQVFSRWGRLVWQSRDATAGWTADESSAGTYFYRVSYTDCVGLPRTYRGWVEVVK